MTSKFLYLTINGVFLPFLITRAIIYVAISNLYHIEISLLIFGLYFPGAFQTYNGVDLIKYLI